MRAGAGGGRHRGRLRAQVPGGEVPVCLVDGIVHDCDEHPGRNTIYMATSAHVYAPPPLARPRELPAYSALLCHGAVYRYRLQRIPFDEQARRALPATRLRVDAPISQ